MSPRQTMMLLLIGSLTLAACGQGRRPVQLPATRPAEAPAISPAFTRPAKPAGTLPVPTRRAPATPPPGQLLPTLPPDPRLPIGTVSAGTVIPPRLALTLTALPLTPIPIPLQSVTRVTEYDAIQAITTYARDVLGISVNVVRAGGARGTVTLPPSAERDVEAGMNIAGATYAGVLSDGGASVSLGQGTISGDLVLDIQAASLGAFSLLYQDALPPDQAGALLLIKQAFPGIAGLEYTPIEAERGLAFVASTSYQGIDWKTRQATAIVQSVQAGVIPVGRDQIAVYAIVGNGTFATAIK